MFDIGLSELLIILVVALIALGPKRLPEMAKALGRGLAEFRRASEDIRRSVFMADEEPERPAYRDAFRKPAQPPARERTASSPATGPQAPPTSEASPPDAGTVSTTPENGDTEGKPGG